jgi:hypothetical protein
MRRISVALALMGAIAVAGCGAGGSSTSGSGSGKGVNQGTFRVTIQNGQGQTRSASGVLALEMLGGRVTSAPPGISCAAGSLTGCTYDFPLGTSVVLTATPDGGKLFLGWAGDCSGEAGCTLAGNADKYIVATFGTAADRSGHPNYTSPSVHGPAYAAFAAGDPNALGCTSCHGATLQGQGIAVSCTGCHAWPVHGKIVLRDSTGAPLTKSSTAPYNPKATCGTAGCHGPAWARITQGYHFAQGRTNAAGVIQISDDFSKYSWVMSDGMYGKY